MPTPDSLASSTSVRPAKLAGPLLDALDRAVDRLRFGIVQLTVHEGRVVQLEVTEKHRF
jgi:hypothetical protein